MEVPAIRRLKRLSIKELEEIELELQLKRSEDQQVMRKLIDVQEVMYRKLNKNNDNETVLNMLKRKVVSNLVHYGSYLKTEYQQDNHSAETTLLRAIKINRDLPIAYYRLGFLAYKAEQFDEAMTRFQHALKHQKKKEGGRYSLNQQQIYNAILYLSNSALHIALETQNSLELIEGEVNKYQPVNLPLSPLYNMIAHNEDYLSYNAYVIITDADYYSCSVEEMHDMIDEKKSSHVVLFYSDREIFLYYKDSHITLSANRANILKRFLLDSNESSPLTKYDFIDEICGTNGEVKTNTYTIYVRRIRNKLEQCQIPRTIITNAPKQYSHDETSYYYDHSIPYVIIQRTDTI